MNLSSITRSIRKNLKRTDRAEEREKGRKGAVETKPFRAANAFPFSPSQFAATCGIAIRYETLPRAFGRVVYLAEASLQPPRITVNTTALAQLADCATQVPDTWRPWFSLAALTEVVVAHELYHILMQQASRPSVEDAAHEFAQRFTGVPFSPRVYEVFLQQAAQCWTTTNII